MEGWSTTPEEKSNAINNCVLYTQELLPTGHDFILGSFRRITDASFRISLWMRAAFLARRAILRINCLRLRFSRACGVVDKQQTVAVGIAATAAWSECKASPVAAYARLAHLLSLLQLGLQLCTLSLALSILHIGCSLLVNLIGLWVVEGSSHTLA